MGVQIKIQSNRHVVYACTYHVVWCPKYRRPVLQGMIRARLMELLRETTRDKRADLVEMEVLPDQVHLLIGVDPQFGIHRLVKAMKGRSSHALQPGVSAAQVAPSYAVDKQLFCRHRGESTVGSHQTVHCAATPSLRRCR